MTTGPVIQIEDASFCYRPGTIALDKINLTIQAGEFTAFIGNNGSGKTTLMKLILGLLKPTQGRVLVGDIDTREAKVSDMARRIGFIFQDPNEQLFANTVEEEICFGLRNLDLPEEEVQKRADETIALFGLDEIRTVFPRFLARGDKQKVCIAALGKFNLLHDAPLRDLTERPLVNQRIIPTTLHQPGIGAYGTFYPTALSKLDYEFYVTNGFTNAFGGDGNPNNTSNINQKNGIRSARSSNTSFDNNNGKSLMGRVAFSPILGVEIGGSGFYGNYGTRNDDKLSIVAMDWTFQRGPFEIIGESAWAHIKNNDKNQDGTKNGNPEKMQGYYIQGNYHFLPEWLSNMAPTFFKQEVSTFTAVARWEQMKLGKDLSGEARKLGEWQRWTFGLNFRPTEDTVFKADFQYTPVGRNGDERIHDRAFVASWATYF